MKPQQSGPVSAQHAWKWPWFYAQTGVELGLFIVGFIFSFVLPIFFPYGTLRIIAGSVMLELHCLRLVVLIFFALSAVTVLVLWGLRRYHKLSLLVVIMTHVIMALAFFIMLIFSIVGAASEPSADMDSDHQASTSRLLRLSLIGFGFIALTFLATLPPLVFAIYIRHRERQQQRSLQQVTDLPKVWCHQDFIGETN